MKPIVQRTTGEEITRCENCGAVPGDGAVPMYRVIVARQQIGLCPACAADLQAVLARCLGPRKR